MASIKELEDRPMTLEEYKELDRQNAKRRTRNETRIYGQVSKKTVGDPRPRIDKTTKLPICDGDGNQLFYKPSMSITFDFTGGSLELQIDEVSLFDSVLVFESYEMTARHGAVRSFGKDVVGLIPLKFEI